GADLRFRPRPGSGGRDAGERSGSAGSHPCLGRRRPRDRAAGPARTAVVERAVRRTAGSRRPQAIEDVLSPARCLAAPTSRASSGRAQRERRLRERVRRAAARTAPHALERPASVHALPVRALTRQILSKSLPATSSGSSPLLLERPSFSARSKSLLFR